MRLAPRRHPSTVGIFLLLALAGVVAFSASCGTEGDDTLGVSLIEDRGERKAVRLIEVAADTSTSFQATEAAVTAFSAPTLLVSARPGYEGRSLTRFESGLPPAGTVVDSATVVFRRRDAYGTSPFSLSLHLVAEAWPESTMVPDSFPDYDPTPLLTIDVSHEDDTPDTFAIRLDAPVQAWVDDPASNFGLALLAAPGEAGELELESRESPLPPRLIVHWTVGGSDTSAVVSPAADLFSLGTTVDFVPLPEEPRRIVVARGFAARSFVKFPFPDPGPRATIHRAEMTLHLDPDRSAARSFNVGIRRIEEEPWNGFETAVSGTFASDIRTLTTSVDSTVINVTGLLIAQLAEENHGLEIRAIDERPDTDYLRFHAHDTETPALAPTLRVWYTPGDLPEDAP